MKRLLFGVTFVVAILAVGAVDVRAQTRADSAAVLLNAAEQLRLRGEAAAARALLQYIQQQYAGTPAALEVDRMRALLQRAPEAEQSGRTELLVFGTTYGAWLGIAVPLMFESESSESYGLGLLLGAPIGFFAAKSYADTYHPTEGQTRALTFGGTWGTFQGFLLAELLDLGQEEFCDPYGCTDTGTDDTARLTSGVVGGLAGIATGAVIAQKPITAGTAAAVTLSGAWGTWFGFGLGVFFEQNDDALIASTMAGGNAALIAAGISAPRWEMTESRARLISLGGLIGGLGGAGLLLLLTPESEKAIAVPLATSVAGLLAAAHWTRDRDVGDSNGDANSGALLDLRAGRWTVSTPVPKLQLQRTGTGTRTGAYVPLLQARF